MDYQNGDVYYNPLFCDLWVVANNKFVKINEGYEIDLDEPEGFIKVGHIDFNMVKFHIASDLIQ